MHHMTVQEKYYRLLKTGKKTIELRLFDQKRKKIKPGDAILFTNASDLTECFQATVVQLHHASCFTELCQKITPAQAGFSSVTELTEVLEQFYPLSSQNQFGVVGIEISV